MLHTVEQLIARINVMHDKAIELHRVRNEFSEISGKTYDHVRAKALVEDIQELAFGIANDKEGKEILTEMEYKKLTKDKNNEN